MLSSDPHELPCPRCGYDLRATALQDGGRRCPECGNIWRGRRLSRIPWIYRQTRGSLRTFLQTIWLAVRHPAILAAEIECPVRGRDVRRFYRVVVCSCFIILMAFLATTDAATVRFLEPQFSDQLKPDTFWIAPFLALADSLWGLLPLAVATFLAIVWSLGIYRWIFWWTGGQGYVAGRASRQAIYFAGLAPIESLLLGLSYASLVYAREELFWNVRWNKWMLAGCIASAAIALGMFLLTSLTLSSKAGPGKWRRGTMLMLMAPFTLLLYGALLLICFWIAGYIAMAVVSSTH